MTFKFDRRGRGAMHGGVYAKSKNDGKAVVGELFLYEPIGDGIFGGVGAKYVVSLLAELKRAGAKSLNIYINSPGGSVFEAEAMMAALRRFDGPKTAHVDGLAASAASFIPMVADRIVTVHNGMWMIHNPWGLAEGDAAAMRKTAEKLEKIRDTFVETYAQRTKQSPDQLRQWMDAETWMTAKEAKARGFTDEILDGETATEDSMAFSMLERFEHTPNRLRSRARLRAARLTEARAWADRHKVSPGQPGGDEGRQAASP